MINTACFPSPWLIYGLALLSSLSPTPRFLSKGRKNQKNVDKRESVHLCSFQSNKSPMTGQLNDCWKCSGDTARVVWYYCMCSLCPRATRVMGRGAQTMSWGARGGSRAWSCETALLQPECLQSWWLGGSFNFGTLLASTSGHGAPWRLVSLVSSLSFSGSNMIWSDTKEDLLLEPLDWNVVLKMFLNGGMKWLQLKNGRPVVRRGPFGTSAFPLKNFKWYVAHLVCVYCLWPFVGQKAACSWVFKVLGLVLWCG